MIGNETTVGIYSAKDKMRIHQWTNLTETFWPRCAWHPKGKRIVIGDSAELTIYDAGTGDPQQTWKTDSPITSLAWHPSGNFLATASEQDFQVEFWEFPSTDKIEQIRGSSLAIRSLAWSPDGSLLAFGGDDGFVRLWNWKLGRIVLAFSEGAQIRQLAWDESGQRLAVVTADGLLLRDASRGYPTE